MELAADANCDARDLLVVLSSREIERKRRSFSDMSIGSERVDDGKRCRMSERESSHVVRLAS